MSAAAKTAAVPRGGWTDARIRQMRTLWLAGRTASQVAFELGGGVTRNAVIAKLHRLGAHGREEKEPPKPVTRSITICAPAPEIQDKAVAATPPAADETRGGTGDDCSVGKRGAWPPRGGESSRPQVDADRPGVTVGETTPLPDTKPEPTRYSPPVESVPKMFADDPVAASVYALRSQHCRYPIGDPVFPDPERPFRFCGERVHAEGRPYCAHHAIRCASRPERTARAAA